MLDISKKQEVEEETDIFKSNKNQMCTNVQSLSTALWVPYCCHYKSQCNGKQSFYNQLTHCFIQYIDVNCIDVNVKIYDDFENIAT